MYLGKKYKNGIFHNEGLLNCLEMFANFGKPKLGDVYLQNWKFNKSGSF